MPYPELPALLGRYEYALNVNSVTDSQTMCSRRVLQMAACGMKIITNPSPAIEAMEGLRLLRRCGDGGILYFESDASRVAARYGTAQQFASVLDRSWGTGRCRRERRSGASEHDTGNQSGVPGVPDDRRRMLAVSATI